MTYELTKQLKDAGFPQTVKAGHLEGRPTSNETAIVCYFPTLSELIEACGDGFGTLERSMGTDRDGKIVKGWCADTRDKEGNIIFCEDAPTPEEAVAHLWLALHNKD